MVIGRRGIRYSVRDGFSSKGGDFATRDGSPIQSSGIATRRVMVRYL